MITDYYRFDDEFAIICQIVDKTTALKINEKASYYATM